MRYATIAVLTLAGCVAPLDDAPLGTTRLRLGGGGAGGGVACGGLCASKLTVPSGHASADWAIDASQGLYNGEMNHLSRWGWNVDNGDPAEHRFGWFFESHYYNPPDRFTELHLQYVGPNATPWRRPITVVVDKATHRSQVGFHGLWQVRDSTGAKVRTQLDDSPSGQAAWRHYDVIQQWETFNTPMLRGLTGTAPLRYIELLRVGNSIGRNDVIRMAALGDHVHVEGPLTVAPDGSNKRLEVSAYGIGYHGKPPQPPCVISDGSVAAMLAELLQCMHDSGQVVWAGAQ